jgi:hypothetical protein
MVNEPAAAVGTSGNLTATGSSIEREQLRYASETYRLDPKGDVQLRGMLGHQVRVTGTITEKARVPNGSRDEGDVGTNQSLRTRTQEETRDHPGLHLDANDLAKLDVTSASAVSDSCGNEVGSPAAQAPRTDRPAPAPRADRPGR